MTHRIIDTSSVPVVVSTFMRNHVLPAGAELAPAPRASRVQLPGGPLVATDWGHPIDRDEPTPGPWFSHVRDLAKRLGLDVRCRSNRQIVEAIWQVAEPDVQRAWLAREYQR